MSLINLQDIQKTFNKGRTAITVLEGFQLTAEAGELVAVVGPSGAGKSTLLHILGGLEKPDAGTVFFDGKEIYSLDKAGIDAYRNTSVGFVFQFHYLLDDFTALENVMMPALIRGDSRADAEERARKLLERVGLSDRAEHFRVELSGGEQQRVAVARALMNAPKLILADEPTGNLDRKNSEEVFDILKKLAEEEQVCILMVTHDDSLARECHREVRLEKH